MMINIILDEASMISAILLAFIHYRLDELFGNRKNNAPFCNMNIILTGDLFQVNLF